MNNYLNTLLSKYWDHLIKKINLKRNLFLFDKILLNIQTPVINIKYIKFSYSIDLDTDSNKLNKTTNSKNILIEIPLNKDDYYFEINLLFKDKVLYNDLINIEFIIETFIKNNVKSKFKYKLFFNYK